MAAIVSQLTEWENRKHSFHTYLFWCCERCWKQGFVPPRGLKIDYQQVQVHGSSKNHDYWEVKAPDKTYHLDMGTIADDVLELLQVFLPEHPYSDYMLFKADSDRIKADLHNIIG